MGRPLTGKKHVGIRRDTRPNGDVYVYERVTGYDAKTQKTKTISPENRGIYTQSDSPKKSSRNIWSLAVVSVDQRY